MGNFVRGKIITTRVLVFLDETSYFRYYIFSDWNWSFVKRNKKKILHLLYVLLRQQIISTAKISVINEATTDLNKLQVCRLENELANFYRNLERRTFHVCQANLSGPTFCFRKTICMTMCGNEQKFIKQNFETMSQYNSKN